MMSEVSNTYILKVVSSICVVVISGVIGIILMTGDMDTPYKLLGIVLLVSSTLTMLGVYLASKFWETKRR